MRSFSRYAVLVAAAVLMAAVYASHASGPGSGVMLRNFPISPSGAVGNIPPGLSKRPTPPGSPVFVIVKFTDRFNQDDRERLSGRGIRFYGYVPVNAFLAKVPPGLMDGLKVDPSVSFVGDYLPAYRLDSVPLGWVERGETGTRRLMVQVFDDEPLGPVIGAIKSLGGSVQVYTDRPGLNGKFLRVQIDASGISGLAGIDGVQWVEPEPVPKLFNDKAAVVTNVSAAWTQPAPLTGTGQVVAVCDTGLDTGNTSTLHPDFSGLTSDGQPKLKQTFAYGRVNKWSDPNGHGTHTSGSVLGNGVESNQLVPGLYIKGMAWDAQLVMQSVLNPQGGLSIPSLYGTVFPDAYGTGARIHSNSWGDSLVSDHTLYTSLCVEADTYMWEHKDFLVVFSTGNDGVDNNPEDGVVDPGSVSPPATAKNVLSVGASENDRPNLISAYGTNWPPDFPSEPIFSDNMGDSPGGMVAFSSRGLCQDGRLKPDIVAPGTWVLSTKSSLSSSYWSSASAIGYDASLDPYYATDGGTSMSTPIVSGASALVRQFLIGNGHPTPSSALIKAILVAGAHDMTPGQYSPPYNDVTARPDMNQGWGRLDLKASLFPDPPDHVEFVEDQVGLATGSSTSYNYGIADASVPLRVNLVWTDYPSTSVASLNLVNDLDLIVTAPDGTVYHGNMYAGSDSIPNTSSYDGSNNVEGVTIPAYALSTGTLDVTVSGYNVPQGPQPFALVVKGGLSEPPAVGSVEPASGLNNTDTSVTIRGSGFQSGVTVDVGGTGCGVGYVSYSTIDATVPYGLAAGAKDVRVHNPDGGEATLAGGFTVLADGTPPQTPSSLFASPGDGSANLTWSTVGDADLLGYRVYYSSYSTTAGAAGTYDVSGLVNGVTYAFYVRALDKAGNLGGASNQASATPLAPDPELPHYGYDGSGQFSCGACHTEPSGGLLPAGFDYRTDPALCLSCHNTASVAHDSAVGGYTHAVFSDVTAGGASMPTFGSVTSGEYSDTLFTHLKDGAKITCTTCHNVMQKPNDVGRAWEVAAGSGTSFTAGRGGWWDRGSQEVRMHRDGQLWTPTLSRDRTRLRVEASGYVFNRYSGTVIFDNPSGGTYAYFTLDDPYLRAPIADGTACSDCHRSQAMHMGLDCLYCHRAHGTPNIAYIRDKLRKPDGGIADVVFKSRTGLNSFADGDSTYDGICEVCHTKTLYYRSDGSGLGNHTSTGLDYSGTDCTVCHTHSSGFAK